MIPWAKPVFRGKEQEYLNKALESTWISGGYYIEKFERDFSERIGARFGITTSNGTTALHLALLALGIGLGHEVIVPGYTFVAPVNMVMANGAQPVFVDIDPATCCIDPRRIKEAITEKTRAIIPVHIYGNICDMNSIKNIADEHKLFIVEDTAESAFSAINGKFAGTIGDIGCFSFQATKTITMGEGGFVATNNAVLHQLMRKIRDHGMKKDKRYWHDTVGFNFRLTNLQAAVGCGQFEELERILVEKQRVYSEYKAQLENEKGITMQYFDSHIDPVVWAVAVKVDPALFHGNRDFLITAMHKAGIETRPGFYPFRSMPPYDAPFLHHAEETGLNIISFPSFPSLTNEEITFICSEFKKLRI